MLSLITLQHRPHLTEVHPEMQAASSKCTVIITTSLVPSAPSTNLISQVLASFEQYCAILLACNVIVVFDTYDRVTEQARLKKGCVTPHGAKGFDAYKQNVKHLILEKYSQAQDNDFTLSTAEAEFGSPFKEENSISLQITQTEDHQVTFIEPEGRLGFGLAVRSALRIVETPYVWVHQHDWTLQSSIPLDGILDVMETQHHNQVAPIRYICLPSIRLLRYADQSDNERYPSFQSLTRKLRRDYTANEERGATTIPLTPLFFWHDKPHLASTAHYMERVFPSRMATKRGTFIEDTIGQRARLQIKDDPEQFKKWATWLYYPDNGHQLCLRHLEGRVWKGIEEQKKDVEMWKAKGQGLGQTSTLEYEEEREK